MPVPGDFSSIYRCSSSPETLHTHWRMVEKSSNAEHVFTTRLEALKISLRLCFRYFTLVEAVSFIRFSTEEVIIHEIEG